MSTFAIVIACWLGINVAFVALRLYHTRSHVHAAGTGTSPELVKQAYLDGARATLLSFHPSSRN
jgi:hypothetical protein